jgi:cation:H+ antiporter
MPQEIVDDVTELRVLLFMLTVIVFFMFLFGAAIGKLKAYGLIGLYGCFVVFVIARGYEMEFVNSFAEALRGFRSLFY